MRGGPAGDLYIFLSVKPHAFFQRDGADLYCRVPISMVQAALGGEFTSGRSMAPNPRSASRRARNRGANLRLRGKGMPVLRSRDLGDLFVQLNVETPQNLTRRQRELLTEFDSGIVAQDPPGKRRLLRQDERVLRGARAEPLCRAGESAGYSAPNGGDAR